MSSEYQIVLNTCPDHETAKKLADYLVNDGLAACVSIIAGIESVYRWQGKVESAQEHLLLIKTTSDNYQALEQAIRSRHPYELPEIVAVPIEQGLPDYLAWINNNTSQK